jgi:uncharacterized protein (TIGR02145 family)
MSGWRLATDHDWSALTDVLGTDVGRVLKDMASWSPRDTGVTRASGFAARPAGYWSGGEFENEFGRTAVFWSATLADTHFVWTRVLSVDHDSLRRVKQHPGYGFSVRCIKSD